MTDHSEVTTYRHACREALVVVALFVISLVYSVGVSYFLGYRRPAEEITLIWGIPDWAFFGVLLPWIGLLPVTAWFCFRFMADDPLAEPGEDDTDDDAEHADG